MQRFPASDIISLIGAPPRYDLAESVGPDLQLRELFGERDASALDEMVLGYGSAAGDPRLRQAIAEAHGVGQDDVIVTVGAMHALFLIAFTLCAPGDEAVIVTPLFPLARNALMSVGAGLRTVALDFEGGYQLDLDRLRTELTARTRLVSLASPQNPSGVVISTSILRDVIALMAERCPEAHLLVDETYRNAAYGDDPVRASVIGLGPKLISTGSLSKCHGAPGLRLGWAITRDAALREQLIVGKFNTVISCSCVDEALALRVLQQQDRIIGERRARLAEGLARTAAWARAHQDLVQWVRPDAGALCCVRLKPSAFDDGAVRQFYDALAGEGVRVAEGKWFGDDDRVFRLGFGMPSASDLDAGLRRLTSVLRRTVSRAKSA